MTIFKQQHTENGQGLRNFNNDHMQQNAFIFSHERKYRLRRHLTFWGFWWLFFGVLYSYTPKVSLLPNFQRLPVSIMDSFFFLIPHMFLSYLLMYFLIPKYIFRAKYTAAAILVLLFFFLTACISALIGIYLLPVMRHRLFSIPYWDTTNFSFLNSLLAGLRGAITIGGLAAAIKLMKYWYIKDQRNLQLQKENTEAQLQLLKAQIHPHFLFNTLNNIYSFTQNTSPAASGMVTGLSDLLRYILYEGNQQLVPLEKELKMIKDYINLEKIRYGNKLELHLDLPEETNGFVIAPLLLLPLIENCFKHGTSTILDRPWINLHISLQGNQMRMKLVNGKTNEPGETKDDTGIGIKNVQKRLLLLYQDKHELTITNEEEIFIINLKIELEKTAAGITKTIHAGETAYAGI
jgi:sensor histidine kinase YesM